MALLEAGLVVGGAYLLSQMLKGQAARSAADDGSVAATLVNSQTGMPATQTQNPTASNDAVKAALTLTGTAVTTGIGIIKGLVGSGAAAGGAGAGAASSGAAAAAASIAAGWYSTSAAGMAATLGIAGIILIIVIGNAIGVTIGQTEAAKHYAELMNRFAYPVDQASALFKSWTASATTYSDAGAGWRPSTDMTPEVLRDVALACIYASSRLWQSRNDALVKYYSYLGWNASQMATAPYAGAVPGKNFLTSEFPANAIAQMSAVKALSSSPSLQNGGYARLTASFTPSDATAAAARLFGDKFTAVTNELNFTGQATAILHATIEGYGGINVGWNNWPGDQKFTETLASIFGWTPSKGVYWVTGKPAYPLDSWWLIDPFTGYRLETINTHRDNEMRVSKKGTEVSPGVFAGFGSYGASSQCVENGEFIPCPTDAAGNPIMPGTDEAGNPSFLVNRKSAVQSGIQRQLVQALPQAASPTSSMLPLLLAGGGVAAFLLLKGKKKSASSALSGFSRRRRAKGRRS